MASQRDSFSELIAAGVHAIYQKGIDQVSVTDVTSLAQVSRPTFYTYFGDLNGLYAEIWLRFGVDWLDAQWQDSKTIDGATDAALLELFAAARRIPELSEVVQPDFERWWDSLVGQDPRLSQNASWTLGARLGYKISYQVNPKSELGLPIFDLLEIGQQEFESPLMQGLGQLPDRLPPMAGIRFSGQNVEDQLTHSAIEVIAKSGVAAASVVRIARRARVSTGTVYPRFKSVDSLIESSFSQAIREIVLGNVALIESQGTGVDQYGFAVNAGFGTDRETWRNYRIEMHLAARHNPKLAKMMAPGFEETAKLLEDSAIRMGATTQTAAALAWFMHVHAIGISMIFAVMPKVAHQDNRYMSRHLGSLLRS